MEIREIETSRIQPNRRLVCDRAGLEALAQDIRRHGQIEPIEVWFAEDAFRILDGEKRWRACRSLGLSHVRVAIAEAGPVA